MNNMLANAIIDSLIHKAGYYDVFQLPCGLAQRRFQVEYHGAGIVVYRNDTPVQELHIFPHGGLFIPDYLEDILDTNLSEQEIAQVIVDNYDLGTNSIANYILASMHWLNPERALAYFTIPRCIFDPNRIRASDQFAPPYTGIPIRRELSLDHQDRLARQMFWPWVDALTAMLRTHPVRVIFHHHTYDAVGKGHVPHEIEGGKRPCGMLFQQYERIIGSNGIPSGQQGCYLDDDTILKTKSMLNEVFSKLVNDEPCEVTVDFPYIAPVMLPSFLADSIPSQKVKQVVYEARKDLLRDLPSVLVLAKGIDQISKLFKVS